MMAQISDIERKPGQYDKVTLKAGDKEYVVYLFLAPRYQANGFVDLTFGNSHGSAYVDGEPAIYMSPPRAA